MPQTKILLDELDTSTRWCSAHDKHFSGRLEDFGCPEEAVGAARDRLPKAFA